MDEQKKTFQLPFDSNKKAYGSVDIHVRLLQASQAGPQAVPFKHFRLVTRPENLFMFDLSMLPDKTVGLAKTTLNQTFLRHSSFAETIKKPVEIEATLYLPNPDPAQPDLEFKQLLTVQVQTASNMGWIIDNNLFLKPGGGIEMTADAKNNFMLQVWVERYEPTLGTSVNVSDEYEFEYALDNPDISKVLSMDEVADSANPGGPLSKTRWRSVELLPSSKVPYLPTAPETRLKINAWKKPDATRMPGGRVSSKGGTAADSLEIPIKLLEPAYHVKLISPLEPLRALDTASVELVLSVDIAGSAAADVRLYWDFDPRLSSGEGRLEPTSADTDKLGQLKILYTPPALFYRPGLRLAEDLVVYTDAAKKHPIGSVRLNLLPTIKFRLEMEKHRLVQNRKLGFEFQPVELELPAGTVISAIQGTLLVSTTRPTGEQQLPIDSAGIALSVWNRKTNCYDPAIRFSDKSYTAQNGHFGWGLPEIEEAGMVPFDPSGAKAEPYLLSAERNEIPKPTLTEMAEAAIQEYEAKVNQFTPFELLNPDTIDKLKFYRADCLSQFAAFPPNDFERILSALKLLEAAASHTQTFKEMDGYQHARLKDDFSNLFQEILDLLVIVGQLGERLVALGHTLSEVSHSIMTNPILRNFIFGVLRTVRTSLTHASEAIAHYLPGLPRVGAMLIQILNDLDEMLAPGFDLSRFLSRLLSVFVHTLGVIGSLLLHIMSAAISLLAEASVPLIQVFEEALQHLAPQTYQVILRMLQNQFSQHSREMAEISLGQIFQFLTQWGLKSTLDSWCKEVEQILGEGLSLALGGNLVTKLMNKLNWLDTLADSVLKHVHQRAAALNVPVDSEQKLQEFKLAIRDLRAALDNYVQANIEVDYVLQLTDLAVLLIEVGVCLITIVFTCGAALELAPWLAPLLYRIDRGLGLIKTFLVRLPQISLTTAGSLLIVLLYSLLTVELVGV